VKRLFGTDGIRGTANADLTPELVFVVARAFAALLADGVSPALPIVMGRDTRVSGSMLEAALVAGITSTGRNVVTVGILPTPALAYITRSIGAAAGVMITASHNPIEDNGLKFFGSAGFKLSDEEEDAIEANLERTDLPRPTHERIGGVSSQPELIERYIASRVALGGDLRGLTIVLDAAYGAAYRLGPLIFERLGATVVRMHATEDGTRINVACGATDLRALSERVRSTAAQAETGTHVLGVGFDGDADRALFVDEQGEATNGDHVMLILARDRRRRGAPAHAGVVGTVMSNIGLEHALASEGITLLRAAVGDRFVLEMMRAGGYMLGGEQSGHIIDLEHSTTGDGIMTAVALFSILVREKTTLREAASALHTAPQVLVNVRVSDKDILNRSQRVREAVVRAEETLAHRGRVLVRPSGTEPLVRVMTEGDDLREIEAIAQGIAEIIREESPVTTL
jgi:phosphoglucosamine mutase